MVISHMRLLYFDKINRLCCSLFPFSNIAYTDRMYFAVVHPIILFSLSLHINPQTVLNLQSCHIYAYIYIYLNIVLIFLFVICFDYIFDIDCLN
jgi:hypothetical protein